MSRGPLVAVFSGFGSLVVNPWGFDATGRYTQPLWGALVVLIGAFDTIANVLFAF